MKQGKTQPLTLRRKQKESNLDSTSELLNDGENKSNDLEESDNVENFENSNIRFPIQSKPILTSRRQQREFYLKSTSDSSDDGDSDNKGLDSENVENFESSNLKIQKKQKMSDGDDEDSKISENHTDTKGSGNVEGNNLDNSQQPESSEETGGNNWNISQKPETSEDDNKVINNQPEKSDGGIVNNSRLSKSKSNSKGNGGSVRDQSRLRKIAKSQQYNRDKDTFFEWKETRYYNNPAHPNAREGLHVLPNFMADHQRNIRLAMMLSVNMKELPTMDSEQLLIIWADNLIGYFGPGVAWENFSAWLQSKQPSALDKETTSWVWEEIAGRLFFFDLFNLLEDKKLNNQSRIMYERLFMNLLRCIWARLNNDAAWDEKDVRVGRMTGTAFSTSYELNPFTTHFLNGRTDAQAPFYAEWVLPAPERTNLAFHSYGVISCDPRNIPNPLPSHQQYVNYEIRAGWKSRLTEGLNDWFTFVTLWGSLDCSTQRRNDNNRWGTDEQLVIPDTHEAVQRFEDVGQGPKSKKEKDDDDEDSKISRGDDDEGNHTPEKDKNFSETLHGDNTREQVVVVLSPNQKRSVLGLVKAPVATRNHLQRMIGLSKPRLV